jgi:hypothetical protein
VLVDLQANERAEVARSGGEVESEFAVGYFVPGADEFFT